MIVERIKKLDINNRPIFTGLYGHCYGDEYSVEDNLCKYNLWQELYRYLRDEGYTTVFYNAEFNFFSYEESQLETFFFKKPEEIANAVFFLTSDQASAITGIKLPVDAGYTATKEDNKVNIYGDAE